MIKIHGVVISRDDWGVLALSVSNALNHVDIVHVLNHGSNDQTAHGLEILKEIWGARLKIYAAKSDIPFQQSLLTNMLVSIAESDGADWIYIFDSDEFLISNPNFSLKSELSKLDENVIAVRYKIDNYISTYNFDKNNLDQYRSLIYKSIPSQKFITTEMWELLYEGKLSFYDFHFVPKIIFRANRNLLIADGAHNLRWLFPEQLILNCSTINCAHLMLISKDILKRKSALGDSHIKMGLPRIHGLRNQLINTLDSEDRLDWFWDRHSIRTEIGDNLNPKHIIDLSLARSLDNSINELKQKFGGANLSMLSGRPLKIGSVNETNFTFNASFHLSEFFNSKIDMLMRLNKH